jgi:hypothetical protein
MTDYKSIKTFYELIEHEHSKIGIESRNAYKEKTQIFIVRKCLKKHEKRQI